MDHYGPDDVRSTGGMDVPPHPHSGLATVSWLFAGAVEHRDSAGVHAMVIPGEVNLMTAGFGIAHSEVSTAATSTLHGVQLWAVLPAEDRGSARDFQHYAAALVPLAEGVTARVFIGGLAGQSSPVRTRTQLLGAEVHLEGGARWAVDVDPGFEHAVLIDRGSVEFEGVVLEPGELGVVDAGRATLHLAARGQSRIVLLGGSPFEEEIVMWWNFIGRNHDEIVELREQWQAGSGRFGEVDGYSGRLARLPAPSLPNGRLRARRRLPRTR